MRVRNLWRPAFLDQDYKQMLRREMDAVTRRFAPEPKCRVCRDTGRVRGSRDRVDRACPYCRPTGKRQ